MDLTPEQVSGMRLRNGLIKQTARWENKTVDYIISGKFCKVFCSFVKCAGLLTLDLIIF